MMTPLAKLMPGTQKQDVSIKTVVSILDFRCQCIQSLVFSKFPFSSNTNRNETERFSAQVASGEELLRANYLPAGYPNS